MQQEMSEFPCDICGSREAAEIEITRHYTGGRPIHVCKACGFVFVRNRRSAQAIADDWSQNLFGSHFTARIPHVQARLTFVAEFIHQTIGLEGRALCEIGAGEGVFLDIARKAATNVDVYGIEPSARNCRAMSDRGIAHFHGTIESFAASPEVSRKFDIAVMLWTLECCQDPRAMLQAAHSMLRDGGHVVLATGSRILVPFKKPLHYYLSPNVELDTHCFRFSANAQQSILARSGFSLAHANRYIDNDVLCMIGRKEPSDRQLPTPTDDWRSVVDFFRRWHDDTQTHYRSS